VFGDHRPAGGDVVRERDIACGDHLLGVDVDALDGHAADEVDVVAVEPAGAVKIEVGPETRVDSLCSGGGLG